MKLIVIYDILKMLYQLVWYTIAIISFFLNIIIPWIFIVLIFVCISSKFIKLRSPNVNIVKGLLGQEPESGESDELNFAIANRGGAFDAPENSVAALQQCVAQKCRNVLFDLSMTSCGELVILHKTTLEKANINEPMNKINYDSLQNFNISEHHPLGQQFQPEKVMKFANLVTLLEGNNKTIFLLISNYNSRLFESLKETISKNDIFTKRIVICSTSPIAIYQLRKQYPDLICGLWMDKFTMPSNRKFFNLFNLLTSIYGAFFRNLVSPVIGISVVFIHKDEFNLHISNLWRHVGIRPIVYTVNSPNEKRYYQQVTRTQYLTNSLRSEPELLCKIKKQIK